MKKWLLKLVGWREQREDLGQRRFNEEARIHAESAKRKESRQLDRDQDRKWEKVDLPNTGKSSGERK